MRKTHRRILLALDGSGLSRELLSQALQLCVPLRPRLDILLVNPPRETTSCLAMLLLRLEHSGIDYRIATGSGDLGQEVLHYLNRYHGVTTVALAGADQLTPDARREVVGRGLEIIHYVNT